MEQAELIRRGNDLYGQPVFSQIARVYSDLEPYMSKPNGPTLAEVVEALDFATLKRDASELGIMRVNNRLRGTEASVGQKIGSFVLRELESYLRRVQDPGKTQQHFVTKGDLAYFVIEELQALGLVTKKPDRVRASIGRRGSTGETERPGVDHGYSPWDR